MLKRILATSTLILLVAIMMSPVGLTSCTKTNTVTDTVTVTVTKTDTVVEKQKDTIVTASILTANSWKATYDRATVGGNLLIYVRGASGNTMALDNEYITFNSNKTGTYTDNNGYSSSFTWNYTDSTYTSLVWVWSVMIPNITVTWEHLSYHDNAIHYTEWYVENGQNVLSSEIRVPR